jgi:uncharacterized membrane protein
MVSQRSSSRTAGIRLIASFAAGIATASATGTVAAWQIAVLGGWVTAAAIFLIWVWVPILRMSGASTATRSTSEDVSRGVADAVLIAASVASLAAVGFGLAKAAQLQGAERWVTASFAIVTVALSWASVHTVFALRYASLYHSLGGGIDFGEGDRLPDYRDFAYVAFTIGMTFQVSDTDLTSYEIRRAALRHALLSYLFGIVIVAITLNVVAGLFR